MARFQSGTGIHSTGRIQQKSTRGRFTAAAAGTRSMVTPESQQSEPEQRETPLVARR